MHPVGHAVYNYQSTLMLLNVLLVICLLMIVLGSWRAVRLMLTRRCHRAEFFSAACLLEMQRAAAKVQPAVANNPPPTMPVPVQHPLPGRLAQGPSGTQGFAVSG